MRERGCSLPCLEGGRYGSTHVQGWRAPAAVTLGVHSLTGAGARAALLVVGQLACSL